MSGKRSINISSNTDIPDINECISHANYSEGINRICAVSAVLCQLLIVVCYNRRRRFEINNKHQELEKQLFRSARKDSLFRLIRG